MIQVAPLAVEGVGIAGAAEVGLNQIALTSLLERDNRILLGVGIHVAQDQDARFARPVGLPESQLASCRLPPAGLIAIALAIQKRPDRAPPGSDCRRSPSPYSSSDCRRARLDARGGARGLLECLGKRGPAALNRRTAAIFIQAESAGICHGVNPHGRHSRGLVQHRDSDRVDAERVTLAGLRVDIPRKAQVPAAVAALSLLVRSAIALVAPVAVVLQLAHDQHLRRQVPRAPNVFANCDRTPPRCRRRGSQQPRRPRQTCTPRAEGVEVVEQV